MAGTTPAMKICCDGRIMGLDFLLLQFSKESRWHVCFHFLHMLILQTHAKILPLPVVIAYE